MFHVKQDGGGETGMKAGDTIFALSSGAGRAGVAVFRISGPDTRFGFETIAGALPEPRRAVLRALRRPGDGALIDRGLALWFPGPGSFSGEDMAEFHIHGGRAVVAAMSEALAGLAGFRPAVAGEFSRRGFENGRFDLIEAEGIGDLIAAETEGQRRQAARQMEGEAGRRYEAWRERLVRLLAETEAALDFSDEEDVGAAVQDLEGAAARREAGAAADEIAAVLGDGHRGERVRDGLAVVIAGPPNAGKSSLMNALARRDVAIVSDHAGTTRDVIEVHLDLGGYAVILSDTAGLRDDGDAVEAEGVRRAQHALERADIVVWLGVAANHRGRLDREPAALARDGQCWLKIASKWDLVSDSEPDQSLDGADLAISVKRNWGLEALIARLARLAGELCGTGGEAVITRMRHRLALTACEVALRRVAAGNGPMGELEAEDLRLAVNSLGRITGRVDVEDLLDAIFSQFCIGK